MLLTHHQTWRSLFSKRKSRSEKKQLSEGGPRKTTLTPRGKKYDSGLVCLKTGSGSARLTPYIAATSVSAGLRAVVTSVSITCAFFCFSSLTAPIRFLTRVSTCVELAWRHACMCSAAQPQQCAILVQCGEVQHCTCEGPQILQQVQCERAPQHASLCEVEHWRFYRGSDGQPHRSHRFRR